MIARRTDDRPAGESFRGLVLRLRGRVGVTQRELAARLGVHVHSVQAWESGVSYPNAASLQRLVAVALRAGGFTEGREPGEAAELWEAALREAPRLRTPFDRAWFDGLLGTAGRPDRRAVATDAAETDPGHATPAGSPRQSWGEAPDVAGFLGREAERELLRAWVSGERCRVVAVLGLGGIGKTILAARLAHELAAFEHVYWRSLRDAPAPGEWLAGAIGFLAPGAPVSGGQAADVARLLELLSEARCLLVLDDFEAVLQPGGRIGEYRPGYGGYGTLLRQLAETPHRSCLLLTSREEPPELGPLRGQRSPVRVLSLDGLRVEDGRALLSDKGLDGDDAAWGALVDRYGGNGLALRVVGEAIRELFGSDVRAYLEYAAATPSVAIGGVRQLLATQIERLSDLERDLLRRLAVEREPVGLAELAAELSPRLDRGATLEAVEGLRRRSLLERGERPSSFRLQSVVLEYVTDQLVEEAVEELVASEPVDLDRRPLIKATAKEYVRRCQERLIAAPLLDRLVVAAGDRQAAEQRLLSLLERLRARPLEREGYASGNLINLLRLLRGDLRGADLSGLAIRQAYLQEVAAQDASLAGAHLSEAVLGEAFDYPARVALSGDGAYVAAGTSTGEEGVWRVADRALLATFRGHSGGILGVALSDEGRLAASGGYDGAVRLWESMTGQLVSVLEGHGGPVYSVTLTGDGRRAASGSTDGTVKVWDVSSGRPLATLGGHEGGVRGVALTGDGRLAASGGYDGTVRVWDAERGRALTILRGHSGGVWGVALSDDGQLVASGGRDGTVRAWQAKDGRSLATMRGHTGQVWDVALSGDGRRVVSGGGDGTVRLWETASGRPLASMRGHAGQVWSVALSRDGERVASGSDDGTLRLWEASGGQPLATLRGHTDGVWAVALRGDGQLAVSGGHDGAVRLWETASGRVLAVLRGHSASVWGVALSGDGRLAASGSHDATVRLWETGSGRPVATLHGHTSGVWGVALDEDGRVAASGSIDGTLKVWDASGGRLLASQSGHEGGVRGVALSRDGRRVASCGFDGAVKLWETGGGLLATLRGHVGGVRGVALSGDGRLAASSGFDGTVRLWETASGRPLATLQGQRGGVWGVALSRDGRWLAGGGHDGTIRLWETASGQPLTTLQGHEGGVWALALSEDGRLAISGSVDGTVRLWATGSGTCLRALRGDRRYERLDITGLTGITDAQRAALLALGAVERSEAPPR